VAYSPLGRGLLAGRIRSEADLAPNDFRRGVSRFHEQNLQKNLALIAHIEALAASKSVTPAQLAIAWVLSRGTDVVPIVGTKRRTYLEENLKALDVRFTGQELERLDELAPRGVASGDRYPQHSMQFIDM
jgi:aryl-alcohol dehydrogenase-like predicted oxidoreductase